MITAILVEPEHSSNVGAFCRIMKNFDFDNLVILKPKCKKDLDAVKRAKHAVDVLKKAKVLNKSFKEAVKDFDLVVGTTAKIGTDYNISRSPITAEQFAKKIAKSKGNIAIVFGREGEGLHNSEIEQCDFIISIPSSTKYPTLNISHAAAVIFYEILKASRNKKLGDDIALADAKDKRILLETANKKIDSMKFQTREKKEMQKQLWKRMIGKAMLTKREINTLFGFVRKIK